MAKPRQEQSAAADAAALCMAVAARVAAAPRAANDNVSRFSRNFYRLIPLLIAATLFCWAFWQVLVAH